MVSDPRFTNVDDVLSALYSMGSEENREGMGRFGIKVENALGIKVTDLRKFARRIVKGHEIALDLWDTGIHEARILATIIGDPAAVDEQNMERWAAQFDSWDIVDLACNNLFRKTDIAYNKAIEWTGREEEFVKRAGFAMMASLAVHDKGVSDGFFIRCLDLIEKHSSDDRNFVKKAVNWALRQVGKRSQGLMGEALTTAEKIKSQGTKSARWIASDAIREFGRIGRKRGWLK